MGTRPPSSRRGRGAPVEGSVSRERLSPQQRARLEAELEKGPLAHGFAGVACYRLPGPDHRPPITACQPRLWGWDNLNIHLAPELADFAAENKAWLRVYRLPAYAPDLNPEGIWSLLKRSTASFAAAGLDGRSASSSAS